MIAFQNICRNKPKLSLEDQLVKRGLKVPTNEKEFEEYNAYVQKTIDATIKDVFG